MRATPALAGFLAGLAIMTSAAGASAQQTEQLSLPNVTVTAPATPIAPPYLRDPGKAYERNPYSGRYRVEEDKFREVPCTGDPHRFLRRRQVPAGVSVVAGCDRSDLQSEGWQQL